MLVSAANCTDGNPRAWMAQWLRTAMESGSDLLLCPGYYGRIYGEGFVEDMRRLSRKLRDILICPGSYEEATDEGPAVCASLFYRGEIVMTQRQLYLSVREREKGYVRGNEIQTVTFQKTNIGLLLPVDAWYPQVPRAQALAGVELILSTTAFPEALPTAMEQTLWSAAQENAVYILSSAFEGEWDGQRYAGESILFSPIENSQGRRRDGVLARRAETSVLVSMPIETGRLLQARGHRDPLSRLNRAVYRQEMFGGDAK